jgi:hypothetical protein
MPNFVFQNGFIKEAFRDNLQKYFDGDISEEELKAKELAYAKSEDYWKAAGVRFVLQWINAPDYESEDVDQMEIKTAITQGYINPVNDTNTTE